MFFLCFILYRLFLKNTYLGYLADALYSSSDIVCLFPSISSLVVDPAFDVHPWRRHRGPFLLDRRTWRPPSSSTASPSSLPSSFSSQSHAPSSSAPSSSVVASTAESKKPSQRESYPLSLQAKHLAILSEAQEAQEDSHDIEILAKSLNFGIRSSHPIRRVRAGI